ncbi:hypothetical protein CCUS01_10632 [Colletotrichum cuscutae]|uniref:Uncharacterized protein n=1 Tax=Colletotrichum cuscutae TaxID=1209917 RepID=A0AAI9XLV2_9PEZI|nr:hypothetical protein CCUS01_10632 [Colletotrichum cuscutae]
MSWKGTWRHMLRSSVLTRPSQRGIVYISSSSDTHMGTVTDRDAVLLLGVDVDPSQRCVNQPRMGRKKKKSVKKRAWTISTGWVHCAKYLLQFVPSAAVHCANGHFSNMTNANQ